MTTKIIQQTIIFKTSPHEVYEALLDSKKHSQFTGDEATISREVGETFTAYGGYIEGKNIELIPDRKIVQSWRGSGWPKGHYSRATFEFKPVGGGTELTFTQTDVPASKYQSIANGWVEYYWEPMKKMLEKGGEMHA